MVDEGKSYLREHHWGIVQGISGVYCAVFSTWEHFYPRDTASQTSTSAHVAAVGAGMTPGYSMPLSLWIGLVLLGLSVAVPAILGLIRNIRGVSNPKLSEQHVTPVPWAGYESEVQWREAIALQNRLIDLGRSVDGTLSSLQVEGLRLAQELGKFKERMGERPSLQNPQSSQELLDHMLSGPGGQWVTRLSAEYEAQYRGRIEDLALKVEMNRGRMSDLRNEHAANLGDLDRIRKQLWFEVARLSGVDA